MVCLVSHIYLRAYVLKKKVIKPKKKLVTEIIEIEREIEIYLVELKSPIQVLNFYNLKTSRNDVKVNLDGKILFS